jgi:hypothetical protein
MVVLLELVLGVVFDILCALVTHVAWLLTPKGKP